MSRPPLTGLGVIFLFAAVSIGDQGVRARDATAETRAETRKVRFEVLGLSCDSCAERATDLLREVEGVVGARVRFDTREAQVEARDSVTDQMLREALAAVGFEAVFSGDERFVPLTDEQKSSLDIAVVTRGDEFVLPDHLAPGKITIVDFYAEWCGPCKILTPRLEKMLAVDPELALRTVDIVDWKSKAAKQATKDFAMPGLPFVQVYGPGGELWGSVFGNHPDQVKALIEEHRRR